MKRPLTFLAVLPVALVSLAVGQRLDAATTAAAATPAARATNAATPARPGDVWRAEHRVIDLHQHLLATTQHLARAVRIMDAAGLGIGVNLSGGVTTSRPGNRSEFERNKALADALYPGRFTHYFNLDYNGWDAPDWSERAVRQVDEAKRLGASGLKEFKRLGLYLRSTNGALIKIDDPKLDPVWRRCGELGLPVSIHVADPRAFWLPYDASNERWKELRDHRPWWFGDPKQFPPREELLAALDRVIARHRETTFVCVHFANNSEQLDWVDRALDRNPNMRADLAARIPEIGRQDPEQVRKVFLKHQDRILFATDFMVLEQRMILGSSGDADRPTEEDAVEFYRKHWRWLETNDRDFPHMTPIQGDWTISGIGLPATALRKIYFDNARKLLAATLPRPTLKAARLRKDFAPDGRLDQAEWQSATPVRLDYQSRDGAARPELSTTVRAVWSDRYLYLAYECPYTELTTFRKPTPPPQFVGEKRQATDLVTPAGATERMGLWERDVVEAFIGSDPAKPGRYREFEIAPNGEQLDVAVDLPAKDFAWSSGFETAVTVNHAAKIWRAEVRIPLTALSDIPPSPGTRWPLNLYRADRANSAWLAFSPTLQGTFHAPERFGWLEFAP